VLEFFKKKEGVDNTGRTLSEFTSIGEERTGKSVSIWGADDGFVKVFVG
jgi:hypothetical protein